MSQNIYLRDSVDLRIMAVKVTPEPLAEVVKENIEETSVLKSTEMFVHESKTYAEDTQAQPRGKLKGREFHVLNTSQIRTAFRERHGAVDWDDGLHPRNFRGVFERIILGSA